jgi:hypothetical protein
VAVIQSCLIKAVDPAGTALIDDRLSHPLAPSCGLHASKASRRLRLIFMVGKCARGRSTQHPVDTVCRANAFPESLHPHVPMRYSGEACNVPKHFIAEVQYTGSELSSECDLVKAFSFRLLSNPSLGLSPGHQACHQHHHWSV